MKKILYTAIAILYSTGAVTSAPRKLIRENSTLCHAGIEKPKETDLIRAIRNGKFYEVRRLIKQGAPVNSIDSFGRTPLMWAAYEGYPAIIDLLLNNGAWIDAQNPHGITALMTAVQEVRRDALAMLLERGANVNLQDINGNTAFMYATFIREAKPSIDVTRMIINPAYGADLTIKNNDGDTVLMLAVDSGLFYLVLTIITSMQFRCQTTPELRIKMLNQRNYHGRNTPLATAITGWHNAIARLLIDAGADVDKPNEYGNSPLMIAVLHDNKTIMYNLLAHQAYLDHQNNYGYTALMFAVQQGDDSAALTLIQHGAALDIQNNQGQTAAALADYTGFKDIRALLLENEPIQCSALCTPSV